MLLKVTSQDLQSISPALANCEGQRVSGFIQYRIGEWVEKIPNSMGIFLYETKNPKLIWSIWGDYYRFFECEAEGLRKAELMLVPIQSEVVEVSREELEVLLGLSEPSLLFFHYTRKFVKILPVDDEFKILVASKIKLIRELEF